MIKHKFEPISEISEIMINVFEYLGRKDINNIKLVSKRWNDLTDKYVS